MKLLLDENISRRIVPLLQEVYPGSTQVALEGLERVTDREIWEFAKTRDYAIVTKDDDFLDLLSLSGYPPKVILLTMGNCSNRQVAEALLRAREDVTGFLANPDVGVVEIY